MEARRREHERHEEARPERERREPRLEPLERETIRYEIETRALRMRDLVHWGPIWAGVIGAFATLIVLALLGLAIGLAAFDPTAPGAAFTPSGIWGAIIVLVAFFVGGWLAGRTSSFRGTNFAGVIIGSMVWALGLVLVVLLTAVGLGGLLGAAINVFGGPVQITTGAVEVAQTAAIWSFIALIVTYGVTVAGAILGSRGELTEHM